MVSRPSTNSAYDLLRPVSGLIWGLWGVLGMFWWLLGIFLGIRAYFWAFWAYTLRKKC